MKSLITKTETELSLQIGTKLQEKVKTFSANKVLFERQISFQSVVASTEHSVILMRSKNYQELFAFVLIVIADYLDKFQPSLSNLKNEFAADLIETRPSWKADDFVNLTKYFRQNPVDSNLNMNYERMMNRVNEYDNRRAQALEQYKAGKLGDMKEADKTLSKVNKDILSKFDKGKLPINDLGMGEEFDRTQERAEREGRKIYPQVNHQKFFEK